MRVCKNYDSIVTYTFNRSTWQGQEPSLHGKLQTNQGYTEINKYFKIKNVEI